MQGHKKVLEGLLMVGSNDGTCLCNGTNMLLGKLKKACCDAVDCRGYLAIASKKTTKSKGKKVGEDHHHHHPHFPILKNSLRGRSVAPVRHFNTTEQQ
jgi:hypothetical protein